MTKLVLHPTLPVYLAPGGQDLGDGWTKYLAFIPHKPSGATTIDLVSELGNGCIVVASVQGATDWVETRWVTYIASAADGQLAFLRRTRGEMPDLTGLLNCDTDVKDFKTKKRAEIKCNFSGHLLEVAKNSRLVYDKSASKLTISNASVPPQLTGFELHGSSHPALKNLELSLAWPGELRFTASLDIPVADYSGSSGTSTVLGQNFARMKRTFLGTFVAENICYPLLSTPEPKTALSFDLFLDPAEPAMTLPVPLATPFSRLRLTKVSRSSQRLATLDLNLFEATGKRLTIGTDRLAALDFHFVPKLSAMNSGTFEYAGAALVPNGVLEIKANSALLGAAQLERADSFDQIEFNAFAPASALDALIRDDSNSPVGPVDPATPEGHALSGRSVVSAVSFSRAGGTGRQPSQVLFSPDSMPLYMRVSNGISSPYMPLTCEVPDAMPMGMADLGHSPNEVGAALEFERSVIASHRLGLLGRTRQRGIASASEKPGGGARPGRFDIVASTPQGFRLLTDTAGRWKEIEFASGDGWRLVLDLGLDEDVRVLIEQLFSRKDIFIVLAEMPPVRSGTGPTLKIEYSAREWSFSTVLVDSKTSPPPLGARSPLAIIKFGNRSVDDMINDTEAWLGTKLFIKGGVASVQAAQRELRELVDVLKLDYQTEDPKKPFTAPFVSGGTGDIRPGKLVDSRWNGFCGFSLGLTTGTAGASPFPPDLQPLLETYEGLLSAHVMCAELRQANSDKVSGIAALIRFKAPTNSTIPDSSDADCSGGLSLRQLRVLFLRGGVEVFECRLGMRLSRFFGQPIPALDQDVTLVGTYSKRTDTTPPTDRYSFALEGRYERKFQEGSPVKRVLLTQIGYEKVTAKTGQLLLKGEFDLGLEELGADALKFDGLGLSFDSGDRRFKFYAGLISVDFDASKLSKMLKGFPFKLKSFTFGRLPGGLATIGDLGFQKLGFGGPGWPDDFAYGLTFDMDLGSLGAIARKLEAFGAQLFVGWKFDGASRFPALGLKLNGNRGGPLELSAFDVIKITADSYAFGKSKSTTPGQDDVYYLNAQNVRVKLLNLEFPSDDAKQHMYFYYPLSKPSAVGFAYGRRAPGTDLELLGIGKNTTVFGLDAVKTVEEGVDLVANALSNVDEDDLPIEQGKGLIYSPDIDWFFALWATVFDLAEVKLLMADPRLYGARITLPASKWGLQEDWFIDMLYRRLDDRTGIFSIEVPPPISVLDFGAVQVILPTVRFEFGSPGDHLLVDVGFPEKKSLASWARTGKVVAGIFGGEGGAYFGKIAAGAFELRLSSTYAQHYRVKDGVFTAGIAASFGLMRYFATGPLTGHASLTGFFTAEGAIATIEQIEGMSSLNPAPPSQFLSLSGAFGIKGSVEACVDFGIIKVAVGFNMTVMFALPYKTWHPIVMTTSVTVNAYARVVIANIKIPFDGRLQISITFSFSFEYKVEVQLSEADSRLRTVFDIAGVPSVAALPLFRANAHQRVATMNTRWTWPAPTVTSLGVPARLQFPAWFMASRSVDDRIAPAPAQAAVVVPFLAIGENPQYASNEDSVAALTEVLTRWMLVQIAGKAQFEPGDLIEMVDLLAAHMSLQPAGKDGTPEVIDVHRPKEKLTYKQSISDEAPVSALRPAFKGLTSDKLEALYLACLDAQAVLPVSKSNETIAEPRAVIYPLPPAFELFVTTSAPTPTAEWDWPTESGIDLSEHQPLSEGNIETMKDSLNRFYATLKVDPPAPNVNRAGNASSLQRWLFLYWHQILCAELIRGLVSRCEARIKSNPYLHAFSMQGLLEEVLQGGNASLGWSAAGTASRVYASGLRFTLPNGTEGGMYELAGLALRTPAANPGDFVFVGLRTLENRAGWFVLGPDKLRVQEKMHKGVLKQAMALEMTEAFLSGNFPKIALGGDLKDPGYTLRARRFPVTQTITLGTLTQIGQFPATLVARLRGKRSGVISWESGADALSQGAVVPSAPVLGRDCAAQIILRGKIVHAGTATTLISLSPMGAAERETIEQLFTGQVQSARLGLRTVKAAKTGSTSFADASANLPGMEIFRTNVTKEENPREVFRATSPGDPYQGRGMAATLDVLRAWNLTSASDCYLRGDVASSLPGASADDEVEVLLVYFPVVNTPSFAVTAANVVVYQAQRPEDLLVGSLVNDIEQVPDSSRDAIVFKATREAAGTAQVELPAAIRSATGIQSTITLDELERLTLHGGHVKGSASQSAHDALELLLHSVKPWANQFDLLAYSVSVNDVEMVDENDVIPLLPNHVDGNGLPIETDPLGSPGRYVGHIPVRQLTSSTNPYELVGQRIKVWGHLRDHFGQRAPVTPAALLDRFEEYRDRIVSPDEWDHLRPELTSEGGVPHLVITADLQACSDDRARSSLLLRRFELLRGQLRDNKKMTVTLEWSFGISKSFGVQNNAIEGLVDQLIGALDKQPGGVNPSMKVKLSWPTLPASWCALPFGAQLKIARRVNNIEVQTASAPVSVIQSTNESVPKAFFATMLKHYKNAMLGAGDPGPGFGRYWLVSKAAVDMKFDAAPPAFFAMPPFSNRMVSSDSLKDRDVDLAVRESFDYLDTFLQEKNLSRLEESVVPLLVLKRQAATKCSDRTVSVTPKGPAAPAAARRALQDAVAAKAGDAYRIASILNFRIDTTNADATSIIMKVLGDLSPKVSSSAGSPDGAGVTTIGVVRTGGELELPLVIWDRTAGQVAVTVPAMDFKPLQLQIDIKDIPRNLFPGFSDPGDARIPYLPPVGHWLNLLDIDGTVAKPLEVKAFEAPNPRREAVATPTATRHSSKATHKAPASLASARLWDYTAMFKLPDGALFDSRVDSLRCEIEYPSYDSSHQTKRSLGDPIVELLVASLSFNEMASKFSKGEVGPGDLKINAVGLTHALAAIPSLSISSAPARVDWIEMEPTGIEWNQVTPTQNRCKGILGTVDIPRNGFEVIAPKLDMCAIPSASAHLQVSRNEKLKFGYGTGTVQALDERFVYRTPRVGFTEAAVADLSTVVPITGGKGGTDPVAWVQSLYAELLQELQNSPNAPSAKDLFMQCRLGWNADHVTMQMGQQFEASPVALVAINATQAQAVPQHLEPQVDLWLVDMGVKLADLKGLGHWTVEFSAFIKQLNNSGVWDSKQVASFARVKPT